MSIEENLSQIATSLRDISVSLAAIANTIPAPGNVAMGVTPGVDAPAANVNTTSEEPQFGPDHMRLLGEQKAKASKSPPAATGAPAATPAAAPATAGTVPYSDVQKAVLALVAAKGRDAAMRVFEPFGLASAKEAKPEQYADLLAALLKAATA